MFFFDEQGWLSQDDAYDSTSLSGSRERFYDERECDIFRSSLSSRPRDKKQHCHLRFADVLLLKKDSEESIASIFSKKWYFRHEWISSQDVFESMPYFHSCCKNWSREDNEADAKSFFRVEIFFFQSEGHRTHCWKMDVVVWSTEAELLLSGSREERVWSSKLGMRGVSSLWIFFFQSWPLSRRRLASLEADSTSRAFFEVSS